MSRKIPKLGLGLKDRQVREGRWKEVREEWGGEGGRSSISKLPEVGKGKSRVQGLNRGPSGWTLKT